MPTPDYREIPLTQEQVVRVSAHRYEHLMQWKWYAMRRPDRGCFYAVRNPCWTKGKQRPVYMHRYILGLEWGDPRQGDHINRDTLDNTDENLRIVTPAQQMKNQNKRRDNKSGYRGVAWNKEWRKWTARIMVDRKAIMLGYFTDPKKAHEAYCAASLKYHGEFGNTK